MIIRFDDSTPLLDCKQLTETDHAILNNGIQQQPYSLASMPRFASIHLAG